MEIQHHRGGFEMKTKEEVLSNATNEHDRKLMEKELDRFEKVERVSHILIGVAIVLGIIGISGIYYINDYFIISLLPIPFLLIFAQLNMVRGAGLF